MRITSIILEICWLPAVSRPSICTRACKIRGSSLVSYFQSQRIERRSWDLNNHPCPSKCKLNRQIRLRDSLLEISSDPAKGFIIRFASRKTFNYRQSRTGPRMALVASGLWVQHIRLALLIAVQQSKIN
jgi:hypothetical protein